MLKFPKWIEDYRKERKEAFKVVEKSKLLPTVTFMTKEHFDELKEYPIGEYPTSQINEKRST